MEDERTGKWKDEIENEKVTEKRERKWEQ